jgi:hypothetical protein
MMVGQGLDDPLRKGYKWQIRVKLFQLLSQQCQNKLRQVYLEYFYKSMTILWTIS